MEEYEVNNLLLELRNELMRPIAANTNLSITLAGRINDLQERIKVLEDRG